MGNYVCNITCYGLLAPYSALNDNFVRPRIAPRNMEDLSGINRLCPFSDPIDATQLLEWPYQLSFMDCHWRYYEILIKDGIFLNI